MEKICRRTLVTTHTGQIHLAVRTERITGILAPVVTPFRHDLSPDPERLVRQCRSLLSHNVGLAVFGTTSEGNSLSVEEKIALVDQLVDNGVDPSRMMPGTGACALPDSVKLTEHVTKLGCAGVLMLPPFYYKGVSDEGLFRYFAEVIERVGDTRLRIYLYNIPPVSQISITPRLVELLLNAYPRIVAGAKDSSGDWANTKAYLDNFSQGGFDVFPGSETFLLRALRHGGAGCISATANVNPEPIARLFTAWQAVEAGEEQLRLDTIRAVFARYPMIPALKATIAHYSGDALWAHVRPPLVELAAEQRAALLGDLAGAGYEWPSQGDSGER